jgi:hypothetical protein
MPEKKERWGAFINALKEGQFRDVTDGYAGDVYNYKVSIGKYDKRMMGKGEVFTSSPLISKRIARVQKKLNFEGRLQTGHISYGVKKGKKEIGVMAYYPFLYLTAGKTADKAISLKIFKMLTGIGIASRVELRALKDLQKRFPGYGVISGHSRDAKHRINQLRARGTELHKAAEPRQEMLRIADYVGLKGMEKRRGEAGVRKLLAARGKARARKPTARRRLRK